MADRLPNRPPRTNWGNLSKNLALWLLVGLLALAPNPRVSPGAVVVISAVDRLGIDR